MFPNLVGKSFGEARRSFDSAVLCGVMDTLTGQAQLNPADACILDDRHCLVFLSSTARIQPSVRVSRRLQPQDMSICMHNMSRPACTQSCAPACCNAMSFQEKPIFLSVLCANARCLTTAVHTLQGAVSTAVATSTPSHATPEVSSDSSLLQV